MTPFKGGVKVRDEQVNSANLYPPSKWLWSVYFKFHKILFTCY